MGNSWCHHGVSISDITSTTTKHNKTYVICMLLDICFIYENFRYNLGFFQLELDISRNLRNRKCVNTYLAHFVATSFQRICLAIVRIIIWQYKCADNLMTYRSGLTKSFVTINVAWHAIKSIHSWQIGYFITNEPNSHAHRWQILEIYEYRHKLVIPSNLYYDISCTKFQNSNVFSLVLQLSLSHPLRPGVKSRMRM